MFHKFKEYFHRVHDLLFEYRHRVHTNFKKHPATATHVVYYAVALAGPLEGIHGVLIVACFLAEFIELIEDA